MNIIIELEVSYDADPQPEIEKRIMTIPVDDATGTALKLAIAAIDQTDVEKGDGEADARTRIKLPFIKVDAGASIRVE